MRKIKRLTSIFLSALLAFSMTAVATESAAAIVDENGCYAPGDNVTCGTYRYYFAMPNNWLGEYTDTAGVYWWEGTDACGAVDGSGSDLKWPGYKAQRDEYTSDYYGVYYLDCPTDVPHIVWNNYIAGGEDTEAPIYLAARQSNVAQTEFYVAGDSNLYDEAWFEEMEESYNGDKSKLGDYADNFFYDEEYDLGFAMNFDNMLFVVPTEPNGENFNGKPTYIGDWYFYYGDGEYGTYPTREQAESKGALRNLADDDEGTISFDVKKSGWNLDTNKKIYCHIWKADGSKTSEGKDWPDWQAKAELCTLDKNTGIATYDLSKSDPGISSSDGAVYCVIFSSNTGMMTYNTIMSGACIGDTLYCNGEQIENPEDSEKKCMVAVWENNPDCGPEKKITSTGNIVGTVYPDGENDVTLVANYLMQYYEDPAKTDLTQSILDTLEVSPTDVIAVVKYRAAGDDKKINAIVDILSRCTSTPDEPGPVPPHEGGSVIICSDGYSYSKHSDGTAEIIDYDGDAEELLIPEMIDDYQITSISNCAFDGCTTLKSVTIPGSVTSVGRYAFVNCNNLLNITIPASVTDIGEYAFGFRKSKYTDEYFRIDGFTISGVKGSVAEEYANEVGFDFVDIEAVIAGDVNGDGEVNAKDRMTLTRYLAKWSGFESVSDKGSDVNNDGKVNAKDRMILTRYLAKWQGYETLPFNE